MTTSSLLTFCIVCTAENQCRKKWPHESQMLRKSFSWYFSSAANMRDEEFDLSRADGTRSNSVRKPSGSDRNNWKANVSRPAAEVSHCIKLLIYHRSKSGFQVFRGFSTYSTASLEVENDEEQSSAGIESVHLIKTKHHADLIRPKHFLPPTYERSSRVFALSRNEINELNLLNCYLCPEKRK